MYKYSPISKIYIKNFRNLGDVTLDFKDSPIISLIGENEAGKTSVVKAFSVCSLHATPRDQKDFIRDGTAGFGVAIELEDGTLVTRMKTTSMNRYSVKKPDGTVWDATKLDGGLPVEVQQVMGMIEEPETKEFLQVRTYEDQLLFVVTPSSTNYKVMYDALKVGQLTNAIKLGSKEANALKQEVAVNENGIATLTESLRGIRTLDIEPLINIKRRLQKELESIDKLSKAVSLLDSIESMSKQLGVLTEIEKHKVVEISEYEINKILTIGRLIAELEAKNNKLKDLDILEKSNVTEVNEVEIASIIATNRLLEEIDRYETDLSNSKQILNLEEIEVSTISKLTGIIDRVEHLQRLMRESSEFKDLDTLDIVDQSLIERMERAVEIKNKLEKLELNNIDLGEASLVEQLDFDIVIKASQCMQYIEQINTWSDYRKQALDYCNQVSTYLKSIGAMVETCPNCGETIVIDMDSLNNGGN